MTRSIAFYAPLKSPHHPTPSGDRTIARGLMNALSEIGSVSLVSEFRSRDGLGDAAVQSAFLLTAEAEIERLSATGAWDAWVTYHTYYKAPDLIGPAVCAKLGIPYHVIEASRASKRHTGPWADFAKRAEAAIDTANVIFYFTERDRPALQDHLKEGQNLIHLKPFLDQAQVPNTPKRTEGKTLLAVGMFRPGDKLASYTNLANALAVLEEPGWSLRIVGGGEAEEDVRRLFAPFKERVRFLGPLSHDEVSAEMERANVFVWPGVNEAFGMVYLEAQSLGLPIVAENREGVKDVVGPNSYLTPQNDAHAFASAVSRAFADMDAMTHQRYVTQNHLRPSAVETLRSSIQFKKVQI